jgi:DNA-binding transcriptional regulator YiaG
MRPQPFSGGRGLSFVGLAVYKAVPSDSANRIAQLRQKHNLIQAQLAERLGGSAAAVTHREKGLACPSAKN